MDNLSQTDNKSLVWIRPLINSKNMIVQVNVVLERISFDSDWRFDNPALVILRVNVRCHAS